MLVVNSLICGLALARPARKISLGNADMKDMMAPSIMKAVPLLKSGFAEVLAE
jgi:hypothetical protein